MVPSVACNLSPISGGNRAHVTNARPGHGRHAAADVVRAPAVGLKPAKKWRRCSSMSRIVRRPTPPSATLQRSFGPASASRCSRIAAWRATTFAPGLRVTHHQRRTIIAYAIDDEQRRVTILGVFHGGQDCVATLLSDED
jgi:hypothetical protein